MKEQITLNFDANGFEAFDTIHEFFTYQSKGLRDGSGQPIKQCVQAMVLDYSPSQWNQKLQQTNNTAVSLNDADKYTEQYGDVSWIYFAVFKHIIQRGSIQEIEELERRLAEARARKNSTLKAV
jgi:hypothetical protein